MYELLAGRDRFIADIRPLVHRIQATRGEAPCICAHPYDLCAYLVATESGVIISAPDGGAIKSPLDTTSDTAWVGYANDSLRNRIEPVLQQLLADHGLASDPI